jgi:hypothetical protein
MDVELDAPRVRYLFERLDDQLSARRTSAEMFVFGGAAMVLGHGARDSTIKAAGYSIVGTRYDGYWNNWTPVVPTPGTRYDGSWSDYDDDFDDAAATTDVPTELLCDSTGAVPVE